MRRALTLITLALLAPAALAAECVHVAPSGAQLKFTDPLSFEVRQSGTVVTCSTSSGGTGVLARVAQCDDGFVGPVAPLESVPGSGGYDVVAFRGAEWLALCAGFQPGTAE